MVASTRKLSPSKSGNYLKKAEELYLEALEARRSGRFNSAVISAVHCGISASDAYTVYAGGVRSASKDHGDAVKLLSSMGAEAKPMSDHLRWLLEVKNAAEYEDRLSTSKDADLAVKHAERLYKWVSDKLEGVRTAET
jgi:HEPN domain-containing protein